MKSFTQYSKAEEEHAEMAVLFHDVVEEFRKKYKLMNEQMSILLNDSIKQYEYEERDKNGIIKK